MCGILGIITRGSIRGLDVNFSRALSAINHRGPDDAGEYSDENIILGHTRLSILDLTKAGHQPMRRDGSNSIVVFNGEIYNYIELRARLEATGIIFVTNSDTEVLLASYEVWGEACVSYFRGMFAFAIWDSSKKKLFMARDRCGEKPFYYHFNNESFYFSSEIKSLAALLEDKLLELDPKIVDMYLHYQYVPEPFTLLKGIVKLGAGSTANLALDDWDLRLHKYWALDSIPSQPNLPKTGVESLTAIKSALEDAVSISMRADVPVGVALSGGIDSGAIAAIASRYSPIPLHAFSVGYPGRPSYDERDQAKKLANSLGIIMHEVEIPVNKFVDFFPTLVTLMDEPIADPAAFGHYSVPKVASDYGIKVLLSGIGGDEIFWGYDWVTKAVLRNEIFYKSYGRRRLLNWLARPGVLEFLSKIQALESLPSEIKRVAGLLIKQSLRLTPSGHLQVYMMAPDFPDVFDVKSKIYGERMRGLPLQNPFIDDIDQGCELKDIPLKINQIIFDTWLTSNCLTLSDRVSMASGVETRLPFLDVNLIELVINLRIREPDHDLGQKFVLRNALQGLLPKEVLERPKSGFRPPVLEWISGVVKAYGESLIFGELAKAGIINVDEIKKLQRRVATLDWPHLFTLYKLTLLEQWYRGVLSAQKKI